MTELSTKTAICSACARESDDGLRAGRCESCRAEEKRAKQRERMRAWRAAQPKVSSIAITCRDCGTPFEHVTGGGKACGRSTKKLCPPCITEARRRNTNRHKARRRAEAKAARPPRSCLDCPTDISNLHEKILRCEPCRRELARLRTINWRTENPLPKRVFLCVTCAAEIDRKGNSGKPLYCGPCGADALNASQQRSAARRRLALVTHCHYCRSKFDTPRRRARVPNRCDECKRDRHRAYVKAYYANNPRSFDHIRRARKLGLGYERFKHKEIFDRDGWKCGICRKRISRRLRWPHPMSVSLDHKIPLSKGGHHSRLNTQASHLRCNLRKKTAAAPLGEQIPLF